MGERSISLSGDGWYARFGELVEGPLALSGLAQCLSAGFLAKATPVWRRGLETWVEAGRVAELAPLFGGSTSTALSVEVLPPPRRKALRGPPILSLEEVPWGANPDVDRDRPMLQRVDAQPRSSMTTMVGRLRRRLGGG